MRDEAGQEGREGLGPSAARLAALRESIIAEEHVFFLTFAAFAHPLSQVNRTQPRALRTDDPERRESYRRIDFCVLARSFPTMSVFLSCDCNLNQRNSGEVGGPSMQALTAQG